MTPSQRSLRVAMVGSSDVAGGSERFAERLAQALRDHGHRCHRYVGRRVSEAGDVIELDNGARRRHPLGWTCVALEHLTGLHNLYFPGTRDLQRQLRHYDVLHLHNLHGGFFEPRLLPRLSSAVATVMTLHDCYVMTGHCAHPMDCPRWLGGCGACPDLTRYPSMHRDATRWQRAMMRSWVRQSRLTVVAPSAWIADQWQRAGMPGPRPAQVANGLDLKRFTPGDRAEARRRIGVAAEDSIVLLVAQGGTANSYKDADMVLDAVRALRRGPTGDRIRFVVLGGGALPPELRVRAVAPGFVADEVRLVDYYRAADVMLFASRADNAPLVIMEVQACGTPVVATRVGGVAELVTHGTTGFLVEPGDASALHDRAAVILADPTLQRSLGLAARLHAERHFDMEQTVHAYLSLYSSAAAGAAEASTR